MTLSSNRISKHSRNADSIDIAEQLLGLSLDHVLEAIGSTLLHALETHLEVDRELGIGLLVTLDNLMDSVRILRQPRWNSDVLLLLLAHTLSHPRIGPLSSEEPRP